MFKRILVVEDDVMVRNALVSILARGNYEVLEAHGVDEALKLLSMFDGTVNMIIADHCRTPPPGLRNFGQLLSYPPGILFFQIDAALREILQQQRRLVSETPVKDFIAKVESLLPSEQKNFST